MSSRRPQRRFTHWLSAAALVLTASTGTSALATPITYEYGGVITSSDPSTDVAAGTRFSGTFTFDPSATPVGISDTADDDARFFGNVPGFSAGQAAPIGTGLSLQVGGRSIVSPQGALVVNVDANPSPGHPGYGSASGLVGPFTVVNISNTYDGGGPIDVSLNLTNPTGSVFGTIPARAVSINPFPATGSLLSLANFPNAVLLVTSGAAGSPTIYSGTIDTLTVVPEPASATLICVVASGWLAHSRCRRSRRMGTTHYGNALAINH